ncbi:MAG: hypothetical protein AB1403_18500 [Candidatus Riflebacteria bacterium]
MKNLKAGILAVGAVALGGTFFVSSTFADTSSTSVLEVIRHNNNANATHRKVLPVARAGAAENKVLLVPPPAELPNAPSAAMVTSLKPVAPAVARSSQTKAAASKEMVAQAPAQKVKPENLFSYVRMLNYSPHPQVEEFLKKTPLACNGKNYWFSVKYNEDWKVIGDEEGYINGLSFEINVMEGNTPVRTMKTPKVAINGKTLKKGMTLGVAEVAPYKFTIKVEEFTNSKKGVSELVFKLDLLG